MLGQQPIGMAGITYEWSDWRAGVFWFALSRPVCISSIRLPDHFRGLVRWLQSVYVQPEHRAKGVFKRLFQHIQQLAKLKSDVVGIRLYGRVDYPAHFDILRAYAERNHIRLLHRYVERHNQRAKDVYQKLGFDVCDYGR